MAEPEVLPPLPAQVPAKKDGRGGRRSNQRGRPKNDTNQFRDAAIVRKLLRDGDATPIEVQIHNMRFYWRRALALSERLDQAEEIFAELTPAKMMEFASDPTKLKAMEGRIADLHRLMDKVQKYRDKAQECANDAAPYCHPRLASLTVKDGDGDSLKPSALLDVTPGAKLTPKEAIDEYAQYLRNQAADARAAGHRPQGT